MGMISVLLTIGIMLLALLCALLGGWLSRLKSPLWVSGYVFAIAGAFSIILARFFPLLALNPPMRWVMYNRIEFALLGLAFALAMGTLIPRLNHTREKRLLGFTLILVVFCISGIHFLMPAFLHSTFRGFTTNLTKEGICIQNTSYTCGPAAAVTALNRLGLKSEEGDLAIEAHTTSLIGTPAGSLAIAIENMYRHENLTATIRLFKDIDELEQTDGIVIAIVKYSFMVDHYVTVLSVNETHVIVGDPLEGKKTVTREKFKNIWRFTGIVVKRPEQEPAEK